MRPGTLYKHIHNTDVAFEPVKLNTYKKDVVIIKGRWYNIVNPKNIYLIDDDTITIKRTDLKNWKVYDAQV